jgi:hypothetical protein
MTTQQRLSPRGGQTNEENTAKGFMLIELLIGRVASAVFDGFPSRPAMNGKAVKTLDSASAS